MCGSGGDPAPIFPSLGQAYDDSSIAFAWQIKDAKMTLTLVTDLDGKDAPLLMNGKPSGETMATKLVDAHHSTTVVKMNGEAFGTSKGTFSDDLNTMTVENDFRAAVGGSAMGKTTEVWVRR
jgi:hypothetical protein